MAFHSFFLRLQKHFAMSGGVVDHARNTVGNARLSKNLPVMSGSSAKSGLGVRCLSDGIGHRPEIFHRSIQLNVMCWAKDQATIFAER